VLGSQELFQRGRSVRRRRTPAHVHVLGHGRTRVTEVIGDLSRRELGLVHHRSSGLAEHVRRDPGEAVATASVIG